MSITSSLYVLSIQKYEKTFSVFFYRWQTKQIFISLMTNQQSKLLKQLAAYRYKANEKRNYFYDISTNILVKSRSRFNKQIRFTNTYHMRRLDTSCLSYYFACYLFSQVVYVMYYLSPIYKKPFLTVFSRVWIGLPGLHQY